MRADDVAFRADAEELAFDGVEVESRIERLGEDFVERPASGSLRGVLRSTGMSL